MAVYGFGVLFYGVCCCVLWLGVYVVCVVIVMKNGLLFVLGVVLGAEVGVRGFLTVFWDM